MDKEGVIERERKKRDRERDWVNLATKKEWNLAIWNNMDGQVY